MRDLRIVGVAAAALLGSVVLYAGSASAATASFPAKAPQYTVWFARAMDVCSAGSFVTVVNPGGINACAQANTGTDASITMEWAKLKVTKAGKKLASGAHDTTLKILAKGFSPTSAKVALALTIRTSNSLVASPAPAGKTYEDVIVYCGPTAGGTCGHYYPVTAAGKINSKTALSTCVTDNGWTENLAAGNIQILNATLMDCDSGKDIGTPGLLR